MEGWGVNFLQLFVSFVILHFASDYLKMLISEGSNIFRAVNDLLFVSVMKNAKNFLQFAQDGFIEYNCYINKNTTVSNVNGENI